MGNFKIIKPRAGTNLATNPSFEKNTTGWTTGGANVLSRTSDDSKFGNFCGKCVYVNNNIFGQYAVSGLSLGTTYVVSIFALITNFYNGGDITIGHSNFTGMTVTQASSSLVAIAANYDVWFELTYIVETAGDGSGNFFIESATTPATGTILFDGFMIEEQTVPGTYIDGDQDGCKWLGVHHETQSERNANSRFGGSILDLADDYGLYVQGMFGTGSPAVKNSLVDLALVDGQEFQQSNFSAATIRLLSILSESSLTGFHSARRDIIADFGSLWVRDEPITIRYVGATVEKEIRVRYDSGLEMGKNNGFSELIALQFIAEDPFWKEIGNHSLVLNEQDSAVSRSVARRQIEDGWDMVGPPHVSGSYNKVHDIVSDEQYVYLCGQFTNFDNIALADGIVRWNRETKTYSALDSGFTTYTAKAMAVHPNGDLYVGGFMLNVAGLANADQIVRWDGVDWWNVGAPSSGAILVSIDAVAIAPNGDLYVGGSFSNLAGIAAADNIAFWDGTAWNAVGTGTNGDVNSIVFDFATGEMYIGGGFTTFNGVTVNGVAKWDGTTATALASGIGGLLDPVYAMVLDDDGSLYITGRFDDASGIPDTLNITRWNGSSFEALDIGLDSITKAGYTITKWNDQIVVGGAFSEAGGLDTRFGLASWNGSTWVFLDVEIVDVSAATVRSLDNVDGELWVGHNQDVSSPYAGIVSITPECSAISYPVVTITRSGGTSANLKSLINETDGTTIFFDYDLIDGETLTIDFNPKSRSMISNFSGSAWSILPNSNIVDFKLYPGVENKISLFVTDVGSPTITAYISWKNSYLGID